MKMKPSCFAAALATALALLSPGAAQATLWNFDYTATGIFAAGSTLDHHSGVLDVENNTVVGITGTSSFGAITQLIAANGFGNDNVFSDTSPYMTQYGFSFLTDSGRSVELSSVRNTFYATSCVKGSCVSNVTSGDFTAAVAGQDEPTTSVPEPASLALVGVSLVGMGVLRRRKAGVTPVRRLAHRSA